jgi:DNA-binding GntR family transcriptional regulator
VSPLATSDLERLKERRTLSDLVAFELRRRILSGRLPMGAELNQFALTRELGVSRAVVREAFRQLAAAGMIRLTPYQHAAVTALTTEDLDDLWEVRVTLETLAARRAARRLTPELSGRLQAAAEAMERESDREAWLDLDRRFHLTICEAAGNPLLHQLLDAVRLPIDRFIRTVAGARPRMRSANVEHRAILAALLRGDGERAAEQLRRHIAHTRRRVGQRLQRAQALPAGGGRRRSGR